MQRGIPARVLTPDFFLPFVRDCGDASDESLQDAWARLLASAVEDDDCEHVAFVHALKNLSGTDIKVLDCLISIGYMERDKRADAIANELGLTPERVRMSIQIFEHLGFFTPTSRRLKGFAVAFVRACVADNAALEKYLEAQKQAPSTIVAD